MEPVFKQKLKRKLIQIAAFGFTNCHAGNFLTGKLYKGRFKKFCTPGLNCYSCPAATVSCPIGSLLAVTGRADFKVSFYVWGFLLAIGAVLGRAVCGFLCPFGLLQDLLNKIPFVKKIRTFKGDRKLRKMKYIVLIVLVIAIPIFAKLTPTFCKFLCPSGTLSGVLLSISDSKIIALLGGRFMWKLSVLLIVVILSVMIYRPFCKYLCPLGAIYAPFNKVALLRMECDSESCIDCGACKDACGMGVDPTKDANDMECIRCGACIKSCPVKALSYEFGFKKEKNPAKNPQ